MSQNPRKPFFEDTSVGRLKERLYSLPDSDIDKLLAEYGIPSPGEIEKPGSYIQNTLRKDLVENRRKNYISAIPKDKIIFIHINNDKEKTENIFAQLS